MTDLRFQAPSDRINTEKRDGKLYKNIDDYDRESKEMAAMFEDFKKDYFSKIEIYRWMAASILTIVGAIWTVAVWVTKIEARQTDSEKVGEKVLQLIEKENDRQDAFRQEIRDRVKALEVKSDKDK